MALSAISLSANKTSIHLVFPPFNIPKPRFQGKFPLRSRNIVSRRRITLSIAATKLSTDLDVQDKSSEVVTKWCEFAGRVSGEWDGYGADFTTEGKPIELPERVVPEAYREWEVKVFDWQTQCPTLAITEGPASLVYKLIRLLPTVGCEADAATRYSIDERNAGGINNEVSAFAYHPSGCYVAIWPVDKNKSVDELLELEHCLVNTRNPESRVRVIQVVQRVGAMMALKNIKVFCEQWYGPFRNGEQLGGCAIRDSTFASTEPIKDSEIVGVWEGPSSVASFLNTHMETFKELVDDKEPRKLIRDHNGLVLLPRQLWCTLKERKDGEIFSEVGWLLDHGDVLSSQCVFSTEGKLKEILVGHEALVPKERADLLDISFGGIM